MVRPDAIQHYMNITGASESLAIQSLEEHDNNLAEAISSHFRDVERSILGSDFDTRSEYNVVEDNYPRPEYNQVHGNESRPVPGGGLPSLLEAPFAHLQSIFPSLRPSLLLDPNYRRNLHHDLRRQLSGGLGSGNSGNPSPSSHTGGEVTGFPAPHSSTTWRNDQIPPPPPRFGEVRDGYPPHSSSTWRNDQIHPPPPGFGEVRDGYARPSPSYGSQVHSNDAEEEMIRAAIEASKKDFEDRRYYDPASVLSRNEVINREDEEMARAISMSLELEEQESAFREQLAEFMPQSMEHRDPFQSNINESSRYKPRSSSVQDKREGTKQKQPIGSSSQHGHGNQNVEASYHEELLRTIKKEPLPIKPRSMEHRDPFQSNINESSRYKPTSSSVQYKRKDMKQKQPIDSSSQHRHGNQNVEASYPEKWGGIPSKELAIKREMLPFEPSIEDGDAISLLVKMPDGSRHGRCFLKFYKLKHLFDFIDATGLVKPGTYRLVRSYPRRDFSLQEGALSFVELGLTNKHEVLFLELLV